MNEELNLVEILKNVPAGTKFWSSVEGEVTFDKVTDGDRYRILCYVNNYSSKGEFYEGKGECVLFPSQTQRDWSKFKVDLPKGAKIMCSNSFGWSLRYYAGNGYVFIDGAKEGDTNKYRYIVPVSDFDFENIESNINKSI